MNWLSDQDWGWWPVLHLRPEKSRDIDPILLLKLTCVGGPAVGMVGILRLVLTRQDVTLIDIPYQLLLGCALFFFGFKFTFAMCWNRRAERLRSRKG